MEAVVAHIGRGLPDYFQPRLRPHDLAEAAQVVIQFWLDLWADVFWLVRDEGIDLSGY